ncbi:MCE-family MCE3A, putative [Babesia ovata]|uniref:MCE-family MCE3A, putative n=1 Tax=Babesia ovata TaxID=189622 RepID=A0A2H6KB36_9APIC|nr:MCE-family MCE3A, putative [Babesia ovata]GBE60196.1 MCE-family MCE3A, putative [Babesia ovata]
MGAGVVVYRLEPDHQEVGLRDAQYAVGVVESLELALAPHRAQHMDRCYRQQKEDRERVPARVQRAADVRVEHRHDGVNTVVQQLSQRRAHAQLSRLFPVYSVEGLPKQLKLPKTDIPSTAASSPTPTSA